MMAARTCAVAFGNTIRQDELRMFIVLAPGMQPVLFHAVPADPEGSSWRAGTDQYHDSDELLKAIVQLREKEVTEHGLTVNSRDGQHRICTTRSYKDSDLVGQATCQIFSTLGLLRDFLNQGGNAALMDGPLICVDGLQTTAENGIDPGPPVAVYCALVGSMNLLQDYRQAGHKFPNCVIVCDPGRGANDGFLSVRVRTHNSCGIASGKELVADFGPAWEQNVPMQNEQCKRFRGSMDIFFG